MTLTRADRAYGALLGLAYGDALSFPADFHRTFQFPAKRRDFLWRTNQELAQRRVIRVTLPFTHRIAPETLAGDAAEMSLKLKLYVERQLGANKDAVFAP